MQPTYLPWSGYFSLLLQCKKFIVLDNVQFNKRSWQQRNKIKSKDSEIFLTVPVITKNKRFQKINEVLIDDSRTLIPPRDFIPQALINTLFTYTQF